MRNISVLLSVSLLLCAFTGFAAPKSSSPAPHKAALNRWPAESLSGTVSMVDPQKNLLVVRDSSGTPYDFVVTRSTRIDAGTQKENLSQLSANQRVSVRFVPESKGDMAARVDVK